MIEQFQTHPSIIHATDIQQICEPLHLLDITTFSHLKIFNDNKLTVQCNNPQFLLNYLNKKYFTADPCVNFKTETTDLGEYLLWDTVDCSGETAKMLADSAAFGFKHIFTIMKKQSRYTDFYHFGTHLSNPSIHQIYINNLDILDRFITFFNAQIKNSKALSGAYEMILNADQSTSNVLINHDNFLSSKQLKREIILKKLILPGPRFLTAKENRCATLILKGKTAKEIAQELGLSCRTIEDRISSLKIKFNAKNKADLIVKLLGKGSELSNY
ncbi:MAG: LuxR family transcriptional regulator [Tatlockia sp.]|nr:LuxR family transcriptional regulator [Tatlockia sp.]